MPARVCCGCLAANALCYSCKVYCCCLSDTISRNVSADLLGLSMSRKKSPVGDSLKYLAVLSGFVTQKWFPSQESYVKWYLVFTWAKDRILAMPFGSCHTSPYPGSGPGRFVLLVPLLASMVRVFLVLCISVRKSGFENMSAVD